ncbi:MAG: tetratricopeptide repeat protein [Acidobacteria bacterium]|nr:tetratricopeptide repeat protein [Acidobacteriota bacterium]
MSKKIFLWLAIVFAATLLAAPARVAAQSQAGRDTVIVLPFENTTSQREYNWIGASFADSLAEIFAHAPGLGVVSTDERELLYQRLRLPLTSSPSRATAIKIAREAKATLVVIGTYSVKSPEAKEGGADDKEDKVAPLEVSVTASVVRVNEGKLWRKFDLGGALTNLQRTQGMLAYQILYLRDDALTISLNRVLELATKVPPRAFESLVKGIMTEDPEKRSAYLQNAGREFTKVHPGEIYPEAEFELGNLYYRQEKWKDAVEHYAKLKKGDAHYAEAAFYGALTQWRLNDLKGALAMLVPLTADMPLTGVYNNAGAISLQAARGEKPGEERERLLKQATDFLARARETEPQDATVLYNYAYALFLSGKFAEAADQLRDVLTLKPRDGEVLFLYAKALERAGQTEAATAADNEARRYLKPYAQHQTEWQKSQTITAVPPRLASQFDVAHAIEIETKPAQASAAAAPDLLERVRKLYVAGQDDELLPELNRVLMTDPSNAEAHLYVGRLYQRRGDLPRAVASLKAALFWNAKLIDAHILLGRIFLEQGDRAQAMVHARTAIQLDPNNQEAVALFRQVETGTR